MRAGLLSWFELCWPRTVESDRLFDATATLATAGGVPLVVQAVGHSGSVSHQIALDQGRAANVGHQLRSCVPGLSVTRQESANHSCDRAIELRLSSKHRPLRSERLEIASQSLLAALSDVGSDEVLILRWILGRTRQPLAVSANTSAPSSSSAVGDLIGVVLSGRRKADSEERSALRIKQSEHGWRALGLLGVRASGRTRQRQLIRQVFEALRQAEAPGAGLYARSTSPKRMERTGTLRLPLRLNSRELAAWSSWPSGETVDQPVWRQASRRLSPSKAIAHRGRVLAEANFPAQERPLALKVRDALRHTLVIGPSGSGKSTLLQHLICADMEAGRGLIVIEPKSDLISDVLRRVPAHRLDDIVVFDPTDNAPIGINPLSPNGRSPSLAADLWLGTMHALYADSWGPRTSDILGNAALTLARVPEMSLAVLPHLLTNERFRRGVVGGIDDPIGLGPFWEGFENWSQAERSTATAPSLNKLRPFLREDLRTVFGQGHPRFNVRQVFTEKRILLVDLSRAQLGPEASSLLGSAIISMIWQVILGRGSIAPEKRHPVLVYADEFQEFVKLPVDFSDALAMSRGLGVGWVLSHQFTSQLDANLRAAVMATVQSKVAFRMGTEDARIMSANSALEPEDFASLGAYECYLQLVADGSVQPWCSGRTLPPPTETSDEEEIRRASRVRWGIPRAETESALRELIRPKANSSGEDIGTRPRTRRDTQ